ncbi:hypothetical protein UFOVP328_356 [uncultured Caudovirales phage]|uniref:Uncharacterized protein n=1 Tax=uncultured Caudovirales phage TaxID=2100421 RepID=A0A6J5LYG2_9CAUD|nr:hypothetical protein UFOVP328_356 [uncultured Caudovirales phage]
MNQYVIKATGQILAVLAFAVVCATITASFLNYFNPTPTQILTVLAIGCLAYTFYNLVQLQASILESRDKLNSKE